MTDSPATITFHDDGVVEVLLNQPPGNILDARMLEALREGVREIAASQARAVVFAGAGKHFSFGASVEEHLPQGVAAMLDTLHGFFRELVALKRPLLAAVRGQCLGAGLELAAFCHRVIAHPDAVMGQPEMQLGVFAPVASLVLPRRMGQGAADHLLLSGATVGAQEALDSGLVDELAESPTEASLAYARKHLCRKSLPAIEHAVAAARLEMNEAFLAGLDRLERLYLDGLMQHKDPVEGLTAFLEKRRPVWVHE